MPDVVRDRMGLLVETADAVASVMRRIDDPGLSGRREGQYVLDLRADEAALAVLRRAGVGVLSEESGLERPDADEIVIIDPVDGSTNASRGVPWYATSLCLVDRDGPAACFLLGVDGKPPGNYVPDRVRGASATVNTLIGIFDIARLSQDQLCALYREAVRLIFTAKGGDAAGCGQDRPTFSTI